MSIVDKLFIMWITALEKIMATKDPESLWSSVLAELKLSLSKTIFTTLFANTSLENYQDGQVTINCPNSYLADLIRKRYSSLIKSAFYQQNV